MRSIGFYNQVLENKLENGLNIAYNKHIGSKEELQKTSKILNFLGHKMAATKAVNYTPEQTSAMLADYAAGVSTETIAVNMGKSLRSVVAKLSREKVYVAKTYVSKTGEKPVKKDAHADAIGAVLKLTEPEIESLTKANKTALAKIWQALADSKPV